MSNYDESLAWEARVSAWANDRNLIEGGSPQAQLGKFFEESSELVKAMAVSNKAEIADAIGDCCVVLCIMAEQYGLNFTECLEGSWDEIKNRKGRMIDGVFVKEEDLPREFRINA